MNDSEIRVQPHSIEAEEGLLAACLLPDGDQIIDECMQAKMNEESFYKTAHQIIFRELCQMRIEEEPIDEILLLQRLNKSGDAEEIGGVETIYGIQDRIETPAHARYFAKIVIEKHLSRQLIRSCRKTIESCYEQSDDPWSLAAQGEEYFRKVAEHENLQVGGVQSAADIAAVEVEKLHRRIQNPEAEEEGIVPTHLSDLNAMFDFGGPGPGDMVVLGARPSIGKSSLGANLAQFAAVDKGIPTMYFNLEMLSGQTFNRMLASRARINSKSLRRGEIRSGEQKNLATCIKEISAAPLYLDDRSSNTILDIRTEAIKTDRKLRRNGYKDGLGMIVIDYLQIVRAIDPRLPRIEQVGQISRGVKALAKELRIPVWILSQLNRESVKNGTKPNMSHLREAGDIEQDADIIILMHRLLDGENQADESINPDIDHIKLLIEKQRDGATGEIDTSFVKRYTRFENFARRSAA